MGSTATGGPLGDHRHMGVPRGVRVHGTRRQTGRSQGLRPEPTSKVNNAVMERPRDDQPHYGEHLGDPEYWRPYVLTALGRHNLPTAHVEPPFVGSFPTSLVGRLVVKLFVRRVV